MVYHQNKNKKCMFPFIHNEVSYDKCIKTEKGKDHWCRPQKSSNDLQQSDDENWGACNDKCKKIKG